MERLTISHLGFQGDGVAPGPVFAPLTLPGEVVTGERAGDRLNDVRIETPSPDRVRPPCTHFPACGGCALQHASDDLVARWKTELIAHALKECGLETDIRPIVTSPTASRRRATFAARRTKKGAMVGFHGRASDTIIPIPKCTLITEELRDAFPLIEALAVTGGSRKGALAVHVTAAVNGLDMHVSGGKTLDTPLYSNLARLAEEAGLARLAWDDEVVVLRAPPEQVIGLAQVAPPPGGFLQATEHGQRQLQENVRKIVGDAKRVADLFAGCGTFALDLAQHSEVHAVESERAQLAALDQAWRHTEGLKRVTHEVRDLFDRPLMADELRRFDAVVVDPPRAGAEAQTEHLATSGPDVIAHVSCNPRTFARDAARLVRAGYCLEWVQPVDQFRWSTHVELVGAFRRGHIAA